MSGISRQIYPKIITRYVIRQLLTVFVVSSLGFVLLLVVTGVLREAIDSGLTIGVITELLPFIISKSLMFALPATVLFSVCSVFGRLVANDETSALRAQGIPPGVVIWPALIFAFLVSLLAVWLNDIGFAWSHWGIQRTVMNRAEELAYSVLNTEGRLQTDGFSLEVSEVKGKSLLWPSIELTGDEHVVMRAAVGRLEEHPERMSMSIHLKNGSIVSDTATLDFKDEISHEIMMVDPQKFAESLKNPAHLYMREIPAAIASDLIELESCEVECGILASTQLLGGNFLSLTLEQWREKLDHIETLKQRIQRMKVVPHRRWANGFSCFAFAVIGIPLSMQLGNADFSTTFGICFLPILFVYYPLFMIGLDGAKTGALPAFSPWFANVICFGIGAILITRECRK